MRVGAYELLSHIGEGGAGSVYRARGPSGEVVAIKILKHGNNAAGPRFERERRLLASLGEGDGFVPLIDAGTEGDATYLAMPLLEGGTLRDRIERGPLGVSETVELGRTLARALGAAHARGVIHRDVKPENVLFTSAGRPLIADLGLAKHFDREAPGGSRSISVSLHGTFLGTASYVAPEQAEDAKTAGPPADVFSLGAVLYECLAGEPPFAGDSVVEVMAKLSTGKFRPLARSDAPRWLVAAIEGALAHDPSRRSPDGYALLRALAEPGGKRRAGVVAALALAVLAVAAAFPLLARPKPPRAPTASPSARDHLARGVAAYRNHDYLVATDALTTALELDPNLAEAMACRSLALSGLWARASAARDAKAAVELDAGLPLAWVARSVAARGTGDSASAVTFAARAIELDPRFAVAWATRGLARGYTGDAEGAAADVDKALELDPKLALAWAYRAICLENGGRFDAAIDAYTKAIELDPRLALAWSNRGVCRSQGRDFRGQLEDATRAIELDPGNPSSWFSRSVARTNLGEHEAAIADATRAIALDPRLAVAYENRGVSKGELRDFTGEIEDLTRALELDGSLTTSRIFRGAARATTGDIAGAIEDYEAFLSIAPRDARAPEVRTRIANLRAVR